MTSSYNILDIVCGKGGAIVHMDKFKFNKVADIEIAKRNAEVVIANFKKLKIRNVHMINVDATEFNSCYNCNYFYFCIPFPEIIMQLVIPRVLNQISQCKSIAITYNNPMCHGALIGAGFELMKEYSEQWVNGTNVYLN